MSDPVKDDDAELERLIEAAPPGPWEVTYETRSIQEVCTVHCIEPAPNGEGGVQGWCYIVPPRVIDGKWLWSNQKQQSAAAALIVAAVNALPRLLAERRVLREREERLREENASLRAAWADIHNCLRHTWSAAVNDATETLFQSMSASTLLRDPRAALKDNAR